MSDATRHLVDRLPAGPARLDLDQPVSGPDDTLRASVHPDGRAVTLSYWGGADRLVLDLGHLDALVQLLGQVKASLAQPHPHCVLRAAVSSRAYWAGVSLVRVAPLDVLVSVLHRVEAAAEPGLLAGPDLSPPLQ